MSMFTTDIPLDDLTDEEDEDDQVNNDDENDDSDDDNNDNNTENTNNDNNTDNNEDDDDDLNDDDDDNNDDDDDDDDGDDDDDDDNDDDTNTNDNNQVNDDEDDDDDDDDSDEDDTDDEESSGSNGNNRAHGVGEDDEVSRDDGNFTVDNNGIRMATCYQWSTTDKEMTKQQQKAVALLKRQGSQRYDLNRIGTAFRYLKEKLNQNQQTRQQQGPLISEGARSVLLDLMEQNYPRMKRILSSTDAEVDNEDNNGDRDWLVLAEQKDDDEALLENKTSIGMDEGDQLMLAKKGKLSLFANILKIIDQQSDDNAVTTKYLIRNCCLSIDPGDAPACMDAKEMVLAALHFLSSSNTFFDNTTTNGTNTRRLAISLPCLPLIRPVQETPDLEKRAYEKIGDWDFEQIQFQKQVLQLEKNFMSSSKSYQWVKRLRFCPTNLSEKGQSALLLKGTVPPSATGKKGKTTASSASGGDQQKAAANSKKRKANALSDTDAMEATITASPDHDI